MKAALLVGILALTTTLYAQAPGSNAPPVPSAGPFANQSSTLALSATYGNTLSAELIRGIDVRKAKPGDPIVVKCTQDLRVDGAVLVQKTPSSSAT